MKFGGTSVGSSACIQNVKNLLDQEQGPLVVVVSALKGVTDKLLVISELAAKGDESYIFQFEELVCQHQRMVEELCLDDNIRQEVEKRVTLLLDELSKIFKGVFLINDLSPKTSDKIVAYGERLSVSIMRGVLTDFDFFEATNLIKTEFVLGKAIPKFDVINPDLVKEFDASNKRVLVAGFICSDLETGDITNLGRGGSDYTAAIFAAALNADLLEIWTDVDGFMSADPRVISNTYVIPHLSFTEATELCNFGAKIIYPPTIFPVFHKNIPIHIRNTFHPEAEGTLISKDGYKGNTKALIKGISSIDDTCLITVQGLGMVGIIGINYRIFRKLTQNNISAFFVSQASSENSISIGIRSQDSTLAVKVLSEEFSKEIEVGSINEILLDKDLSTVAIVGENMKHTPGIAGRLFSTLSKSGISIIACAQGASELNISVVIKRSSLRKALYSIHDSFFLSEYKVLNLFLVGIGTVGGNLIEQIRQQQSKLIDQYQLKLNVVGIARGTKALYKRDGIDLTNYKSLLENEGKASSPTLLVENILDMNIFNAIFIDCTANENIANLYLPLLQHNTSVVTANKIAASSNYENYIQLKETARERNVKFLFETNVGAGLPIINTINSLINSGDKIVKIEAVLSGTLNYIFNTLSKEIPFSQTIQLAIDEGFAEPDPRIDLSGKDVIRKLVILVREAGYKVNQEDVEASLFIPKHYFDGSIEEFWKTISDMDEPFEQKRIELEKEQKRLRFVARYEDGKCEVGLREIESSHPFYDLEGSNNIIVLKTERYNEYPMIIKGYGAGASVTAAGVFSDIISIANVR